MKLKQGVPVKQNASYNVESQKGNNGVSSVNDYIDLLSSSKNDVNSASLQEIDKDKWDILDLPDQYAKFRRQAKLRVDLKEE
jgi:hypothetical protein